MSWKLVGKCKANGLIDVCKYLAPKSGLRCTMADVGGPLVHAFVYLGLRVGDYSSGALYRVWECLRKGVLDMVANACFASGTNAVTSEDYTCYTLSTCGVKGMLNMLPIYLDHILNPLLTQEQFMTEVHHITASGEDAGVVYSEMQENENDMEDVLERRIKHHLYPENCGYRYETGGRLENLRDSCNNEMVRAYHKKFYHLGNMHILVTGVSPQQQDQILEILSSIESDALASGGGLKMADFSQPFRYEIPTLAENVVEKIACVCDDETRTIVRFGWSGPCARDLYTARALDILTEYLSENAASPLEKAFVQCPEPLCSKVEMSMSDLWRSLIMCTFTGVPTERMEEIRPKFMEILGALESGQIEIDMDRLRNIVEHAKNECLERQESEPHEILSECMSHDFLYGLETSEYMEKCFNDKRTFEQLAKEEATFWTSLLSKYIGPNVPHVCVMAEPSLAHSQKLMNDEKNRLEKRRNELGEGGLKECDILLQRAVRMNEANQPTSEFLNRMLVESLDDLGFHRLKTYSNLAATDESEVCEAFNVNELPWPVILDDCQTNFVAITVLFDSGPLTPQQRAELLVLTSMLFESPLRTDTDTIVPYESVVNALRCDLQSVEFELNLGDYGHFVVLSLMTSYERYSQAVLWLHRLLRQMVIDADRVAVAVQRILGKISSQKRDSHLMTQILSGCFLYEEGSLPPMAQPVKNEQNLMKMLSDLQGDNKDAVVNRLQNLYTVLTADTNMAVHIMCNLDMLQQTSWHSANENGDAKGNESTLLDPWKKYFPRGSADIVRSELLSPPGKEPTLIDPVRSLDCGAIMAVGGKESSHVFVWCATPHGQEHPDWAPLRLFTQILTQTEGPLWQKIRGNGLAYGANLAMQSDVGVIMLELYRCAQPVAAYEGTRKVVTSFVSGGSVPSSADVSSARRSLVFELIEREASVHCASDESLMAFVRRLDKGLVKRQCDRIMAVQSDQLLPVARKYLPSLFDQKMSGMAVTCPPRMLAKTMKGFKKCYCSDGPTHTSFPRDFHGKTQFSFPIVQATDARGRHLQFFYNDPFVTPIWENCEKMVKV